MSWGVLYYAFAVFLTPMQAELSLSTPEFTGAFSLALAVSAVVGLGVGRYLDKHGARALMTGGSILASLLVLAWSRVDSMVELYLVFAGMGFAMAAVLYEPAFIVITKSFQARRREALTVLTLIAALASLIFSPLSARLTSELGWRGGLVVLAILLAAITVPIHAFFLRRPGEISHPAPGRQEGKASPKGSRLPGFRLLTFSFVLATLASSSIAVLLVAMLIARGHDPGFAAFTAGLVGAAQIPGRALFAIAGRWLDTGVLTVTPFAFMAGSLSLLTLDAGPLTALIATLFGVGAGMSTLLRATLIADLYGTVRYGRNSSLASAFVTTARSAAPLLAGTAAFVSGYTSLLWALASVTTLAAIAAHRAVREAMIA